MFVALFMSFCSYGCILYRSNSYLTTISPKKESLLFIKDYITVSLIGVQHKIIAKLVANRLVVVIDSIVSHEISL